MGTEFLIQQIKSCITFGNSISFWKWHLPLEENLVAIWVQFSCRLRMKCCSASDKDINWFCITWNAWHVAKLCLPAIPSTVKSVFLLNSCNFWSFLDAKAGKWSKRLWMFKQHHIHYVTRHFTFSTMNTSHDFGSSNKKKSVRDDPQRDVIRSKQCSVIVWFWY